MITWHNHIHYSPASVSAAVLTPAMAAGQRGPVRVRMSLLLRHAAAEHGSEVLAASLQDEAVGGDRAALSNNPHVREF